MQAAFLNSNESVVGHLLSKLKQEEIEIKDNNGRTFLDLAKSHSSLNWKDLMPPQASANSS